MRGFSVGLHARLAIWLSMLLVLFWLAIWSGTHRAVDNTAERERDDELRTVATLLVQLYGSPTEPAAGSHGATIPAVRTDWGGENGGTDRLPPSFELVSRQQGVLVRSSTFPDAVHDSASGYENRWVDQTQWRVFTLASPQNDLISRVAVMQYQQASRAEVLKSQFAYPLLWLLPVLLLCAFVSIWRGLAPLRRIERAIGEIDPRNPAPLDIDSMRAPRELHRIVSTLDQLMERVRATLTHQRAFVAGAGHELRTPLAGGLAQIQVALRTDDPNSRQRALEQALTAVDRLIALVEQLLLLARVDPAADPPQMRKLDAVALIRDVVRQKREAKIGPIMLEIDTGRLGNTAESTVEQGGSMGDEEAEDAVIEGNATLLETLIGNLIDNAQRFSPAGTEINVSVSREPSWLRLRVCDRGAGIAPSERELVFEPFYRGQRHGSGGYGLGLAIIRAIAQMHAGRVYIVTPDQGGNEFVVELPVGIAP